jgi:hypothetical protein
MKVGAKRVFFFFLTEGLLVFGGGPSRKLQVGRTIRHIRQI